MTGVQTCALPIFQLSIGAIVTMILVLQSKAFWYRGWSVLDWTNFVILAGCVQTIIVRLARIFRALRA